MDIGKAIVAATDRLVKIKLPDSTHTPAVKEEKLSERELLTAAKKVYDDFRKSVQDTDDAIEKATDKVRKDIATFLGRACEAHGTTQKKMAEITGIPPSTVSALCGYYGRGLQGKAYGPQRQAHRNRQVECLISAALTPPEKVFVSIDGNKVETFDPKGPPAADKPLTIPNFKETPHGEKQRAAQAASSRGSVTGPVTSSATALGNLKYALESWLPKITTTGDLDKAAALLKAGVSALAKSRAKLKPKTKTGKGKRK